MLFQEREQEIQHLRDQVMTLGRTVQDSIGSSIQVLQWRAPHGSRPLIVLDHDIAKKRFAIEMDCITLIAACQPSDNLLREIVALLEVASELERIGVHVTEIARVHFLVVQIDESAAALLTPLQEMARLTQAMLNRALRAFERHDLESARQVHADDEAVDELCRQVYQDGLARMKGQSRTMIKQLRHLLQIARSLERVADRVTNICEWVAFAGGGAILNDANAQIYALEAAVR